VIGLSRTLFLAGTPSVIVSLWAVPDNPTEELMTEFYRQLKQTGDKAQSLRQAMLKMKDKYPDTPRKWAAFTLIGENE
ncbi:MAG: CHAT domain-containing protein, partial [Cyanobacteriota bacterium]